MRRKGGTGLAERPAERRAEPGERRLRDRGHGEGAEGNGIARSQNTMPRPLILIPGRGLAGGRVCLLKLARPSVIILLHQKGPGPALSRERPRSLTSPPPAEAPSRRAGLARPPAPAPLPRLSAPGPPPRGRAARGSRFPHRARGVRVGRLGQLLHPPLEPWGEAGRGGSAAPTGPGPCPHGLLPRPVPNPPPSRLRYPAPRPSLGWRASGKAAFAGRTAGMGNGLFAPPSWVGFRLEPASRSRKPEGNGCTGKPGRCDPFCPPALPLFTARTGAAPYPSRRGSSPTGTLGAGLGTADVVGD